MVLISDCIEGWGRDDHADHPDGGNHHEHPLQSPLAGVVDGIVDRTVPVQGDGGEVQDGGHAAQDVAREPHLAYGQSELPLGHEGVGDVQRHHQNGDCDVRHRQRHDEHVLDVLEGAIGEDGYDEQDFADDGGHDDDGQDHRAGHGL
ncbi:hypothetical protein CDAR_264351 [Caerostris darwini]|uniref:Uncharacterized protein n=1 Tax=Caerostris darwini TaxID=1538125 RepID=A0AAV4RHP7_9ARAC|nr:hypothetical protein CDAR_264351 [Caerostris darwini]